MQTLALYAPAGVILSLAVAMAFVVWRRFKDASGELPLAEMLRRHGVLLGAAWTEATARQLALAARRCARCGARDTCRTWLDSDAREGYAEFCVNAAFIERAKRPA